MSIRTPDIAIYFNYILFVFGHTIIISTIIWASYTSWSSKIAHIEALIAVQNIHGYPGIHTCLMDWKKKSHIKTLIDVYNMQ